MRGVKGEARCAKFDVCEVRRGRVKREMRGKKSELRNVKGEVWEVKCEG